MLAVVGLVLAAVPGLLLRPSPALDVEAAARVLADDLRQARSRAVSENRAQLVTIDVAYNRVRPGNDARLRQVHPSIELGLTTAGSELASDTIGSIRFFPDGSSTGGRIRLAKEGAGAEVAVDWLTGDVRIGTEPAR